MHRILALALTSAMLLFVAAPAQAGGGKGKKGGANPGRMLSRFDRNQDGKIDGEEAVRLKAVFASMVALDTNHDGQLSDEEIAAIKVEPAGKGAGKSAAKKKTSQ